MDDNDVARVIVEKFTESGAIVSFAEIAHAAKSENRGVLAAKV